MRGTRDQELPAASSLLVAPDSFVLESERFLQILDQRLQLRWRAVREVVICDPAERGDVCIWLASAQKKIRVPRELVIVISAVQLGIPTGLESDGLLVTNGLGVAAWPATARNGTSIGAREGTQHREIDVER